MKWTEKNMSSLYHLIIGAQIPRDIHEKKWIFSSFLISSCFFPNLKVEIESRRKKRSIFSRECHEEFGHQ